MAASRGARHTDRAEERPKRFNLMFCRRLGREGAALVCGDSPRRGRLGSGGHGAIPAAVKESRLVRASVQGCRVLRAGFETRRREQTPAEPVRH